MFSDKEKLRKLLVAILLVITVIFLYVIHHVLAPFIISAVFIYILAPVVNYVSNKRIRGRKIPRSLSVLLIYLFFFSFLTLITVTLGPRFYAEVIKIASDFPQQVNSLRHEVLPDIIINIQQQLNRYEIHLNVQEEFDKAIDSFLASGIGLIEQTPQLMKSFISGFFQTLTSFIVIFIVTAFILIDLPHIKVKLLTLMPDNLRAGVVDLATAINKDLNGVIRGQLLICLLNGVLTTIGLLALKVKYAVTIGIIAGVFSLIPIFGTIFSTIPAVLVGLTQGWWIAVQIVLFIIIIHLIEANLFNPKIMGDSVELHPAIIIFAIFVGEHMFGIAGLLLGVPIAAIVRSMLRYVYHKYFVTNNSILDYEHPDITVRKEIH